MVQADQGDGYLAVDQMAFYIVLFFVIFLPLYILLIIHFYKRLQT